MTSVRSSKFSMPHRLLTAATAYITLSDLEAIARSSGFIRRSSTKCSASGFLFSLIQAVIHGSSSLDQIAQKLGSFEPDCMTRQALQTRFSERSSGFLRDVLARLIHARGQRILPALSGGIFPRILIEDSTVIPMAKSNANIFPNNGNCHGFTAGCKINVVTDVLRGSVVSSVMCSAREPDQRLATEILSDCRAGDLIIRDRGYFSTAAISEIEGRGTFWLSRLPASVTALGRDGTPLLKLLRRTRGNTLDRRITFGTRRPRGCRLIARRLTAEETAKNRRLRRKEAKKRGAIPSKEGLARDAWSLVITNVPVSKASARNLSELYAFRWSIEISFRALKQSSRLHQSLNHKAGRHQIEALVLAAMILHVMSVRTHATLQRRETDIGEVLYSLEKVAKSVAHYIATRTGKTLTEPYTPDYRHLRHDRRNDRVTLTQLMICYLG